MPSIEEQRAVQLANAKVDAELAGKVHDMHAVSVADHERHIALAEHNTAVHRVALAEAARERDAAGERVAAIERARMFPVDSVSRW
jgi:hypothetical protein